MKVLCAALVIAVVCAFTEAKGMEGAPHGHPEGLKTINKLLRLSSVRGLVTAGQRSEGGDPDAGQPEKPELSVLEYEMCGEWGLGGAFYKAYAEVQLDDDISCPREEDFIWSLVLRQPLVLCVMSEEERRTGFECLDRFMEEGVELDIITRLHDFVHFMKGLIDPYLPTPEPACPEEPADAAAAANKKRAQVTANFERKLLRILEAANNN